MEKENYLELIKSIEKRVEHIEQLESIKYPTHLKELIVDLMDRIDEIELRLNNKHYD